MGTHFLVRSCVNRIAEDGGTTISQVMAETQASGMHDIQFRDDRGNEQQAKLLVRHAAMTVCPPIGEQRNYQHQQLNIICAEEINPPKDRSPIFLKLITNLAVANQADVVQKLSWYA